MKHIATKKEAGLRLDQYLTQKLGKTRSQCQKAIKAGLVSINGKIAIAHTPIKASDIIVIEKKKDEKPTGSLVKIKRVVKKTLGPQPEPRIIAKNDDYLVIEKPSGIAVPLSESGENTVASWLRKKFKQVENIFDPYSILQGKNASRYGIVHRLDKDVSGVMVVALTQTAFDHFKEQFANHKMEKEYIALVHGEIPRNEGKIEFAISRGRDGRMAAQSIGSGKGRPSLTEYEVEGKFKNFTLVRAFPKTGRTNQIRVHFYAYGYPIVGDKTYSFTSTSKIKVQCPRVFLHAEKLAFTAPDGKKQSYAAPLPEILKDVLSGLQKI